MPRAIRIAAATFAAVALAACDKQAQPPDQNIVIDNGGAANAEIEVLPPDESSVTPSNQLMRGDDRPDVNVASGNHD